MNKWLLVFIGGGMGSVLRAWLGEWLRSESPNEIPRATLAANILASALLGLLMAWIMFRPGEQEQQRLFWGIGFCGGLSTFSTFSFEAMELLRNGQTLVALAYMGLSLCFCTGAVAAGWWIAKG
jgi:CrcB protein